MNWTFRLFMGLLIISLPIYLFWSGTELVHTFGNILQAIALVFATLACYQAQYMYPRMDAYRAAWGRLTFGSFIWFIAQMLEWYCEAVLHMVPYGTIADCFWTIGYLVLLSGLFLLLRPRVGKTGTVLLLQALLLGGVYAVLFYYMVLPQLLDPSQRFIEKVLDVAYPAFDFGLFSLALLLLTRSVPDPIWMRTGRAFVVSFALLLYSDFILGIATNIDSPLYNSIDLFYFCSYFLIAVAGNAQKLQLRLNVQTK